jgi:hypothetical protein
MRIKISTTGAHRNVKGLLEGLVSNDCVLSVNCRRWRPRNSSYVVDCVRCVRRWLMRPSRARKKRPQWAHWLSLSDVVALAALAYRAVRFSWADKVRAASADLHPRWIMDRHTGRVFTCNSQVSKSMFTALRVDRRTSLYRFLWPPTALLSVVCSPIKDLLGYSCILCRCPV